MGSNSANTWGGPRVTRLRALYARRIASRLAAGDPYLCPYCTHPVTLATPWDLDHRIPRDEGGPLWDLANLTPAHLTCNRRDGQRIQRAKSQRTRRW